MLALQIIIHYVVPTLALISVGAYLEHRLGTKISSRVASVEARVTAAESSVRAVEAKIAHAVVSPVAAVEQAVKAAVEKKL